MYVNRGGEQSLNIPIELNKVSTFSFILKADKNKLQNILNRDLNNPFDFKFNYQVLFDYVFLVYAIQNEATPTDGIGWMPEIDVGFWIPCTSNINKYKILFYQPYLFVDSGFAMATGREVYGFNKMFGKFQYSPLDAVQDRFTVETIVPMGKGQQAIWERVIDIKREKDGDTKFQKSNISDSQDFFINILKKLNGGSDEIRIPGLNLIINLIEDFVNIDIGMVFLKQFRDTENPNEACYQSIVEASAKLETFNGGGFLGDNYQIKLSNYDYYPFCKDFGLSEQTNYPILSTWANFEFKMEKGKTLCAKTTIK